MTKEIKVADIITPFQIVLNVGSNEGIILGENYLIYSLGKTIMDPDTKEPLGKIENVKGKGKVIHVQKKICTVESTMVSEMPRRIIRKTQGISSILGGRIEEEEIKKEKLAFQEVQIGDSARKD